MASKGKERENFFRINVLVVDHIKNALVEMFKYYLCKKNMSFEEFIDQHMADIRYLKRSRNLYQEEGDKLIVGDKAISGLTVDDLEVTLVKCLLDNLCPDLFMDDGCKTLQDFLQKNQHDIYHLFKFNERCCQCSHDYKFPVTEELLKEDQYKKIFKLSPCTNCAGKSGTVCSVSSCIVTEYIRLDYKIKCQIFGHFSPIFKAMRKLTALRNIVRNADAAVIPNELYDVYEKDIEENIMVLARICGKEDETRLALDDVQKRVIGDNSQKEIHQQLQKLTDKIENLKATETKLTKGEEATQHVPMKTMKVLTKVSNSVGMFVGKIQGSCWRAGTDLIVTAWHVVRNNIREYEGLNWIKLKEVKIKFEYTGSGDCDESNIFEVEPRVLYYNETLDTAILRLKPNDKVKFPPPFRRLDHFLIPAEDEDLTIYLIGHPNGSPQQVNLDVGLWNPTEERMQSLATFCKDEGYEYGYAELDKTERLVVKCEFEHGASGCPGVVFLGDNQVYLVTMFLKGFPDFYWSRLFKGEKKKKFPKSKLFQQGVNIRAIYEDLKKNPKYADIFEDIFKQNPPVNMGTCEEETNVSTCTHPTTVERQGSQMVVNDPQSPMMGTSDEIKVDKELLSKGTFISYDNCVYLGGACNVGKSTLASILIGEEISQHWKSTDGLTIYFGRNGIDLKNKKMVPLKQDFDRNVLSKVLRGKPDMTPEKPDTTHREEVLPHDSNKGNIITKTHTDTQHTDITAPTPSLVPGTGKDDVNITDPVRQQSPQNYIITTIQEDIKEEIRKGTYKIEIAPSDLVDFGGQRSFDMTHQLFMRRKGTFVLMFNGRIDFLVPLEEYKQGETTKSILKHWVNSILSYCADDDDDILPIILFCATHSDDFKPEDHKDRKEKLIHDLGEIFKNHKRQNRIIYDEIFFINGQDEKDLEINKLKSKLVEVAFKQNSWGKRMPMACVPLDLQMSELRLHNMSIISKEELITLNKRNEDLALTDEQIKYFLNDQHSLGKIVYFDQHGLDNFINLQPQSLVNILRSFITAECFWPEDKELKGILRALTDTGKIAKQDLLKLWSQKKFHEHMPNDDFKEFIIQVLIHLDILVETRHHRQKQESKVQSYLVPCTVKRRLPVTDFYVKSADKMICLSYTLLKSSMPAALSFKLIGAAMNVWPLKETPEGLYHQAAILCIDGSNELHLLVEDDKVFVYLINKNKKCSIPPNIASAVQECLTLTMTKVLEFYHKSFGKSLSTLDVSKDFEIEVGEWCTSKGGCYISVPELEKETEWRCKNNKTHNKTYPRYWICNKKQVKCDEKCPGLDEKHLELPPEEKHLFRLAKLITVDECYNLVIKLGLSRITWNDIDETDRFVKKCVALYKWKVLKYQQMSKPSFKELSDALAEYYHTHFLCQLFMEDVTVYEIANRALQEIPKDDVLQDLSKEVGNCAMHLGVELGLSMAAIEGILFKYPKNTFKQTLSVMEEWKSSSAVKPTILMLMKAFQSADGRGLEFLREKYGVC